MAIRTIYLRAFPWPLSVIRDPSDYGDRTIYPVKTDLALTHDIYWRTKRLLIHGSVEASNEVDGVGLEFSDVGENRGNDPESLMQRTGGLVGASATDDLGTIVGTVDYQFDDGSAAEVHDYKEQFLRQFISGGIETTGTPDPSFNPNFAFSSIASAGSAEVGRCICVFGETYEFPIYVSQTNGLNIEIEFTITRVKWED